MSIKDQDRFSSTLNSSQEDTQETHISEQPNLDHPFTLQPLTILADDLVKAFVNDSIDIVYYLDLSDGSIVSLVFDENGDATNEEMETLIDLGSERFVYLEPLLPVERVNLLRSFISEVTNPSLIEILELAH
jgi:hypothetical protein